MEIRAIWRGDYVRDITTELCKISAAQMGSWLGMEFGSITSLMPSMPADTDQSQTDRINYRVPDISERICIASTASMVMIVRLNGEA